MEYYDPEKNPLNQYKIRNVIKSIFDSNYFIHCVVIASVVAVIVHQIMGA